MDHLNGGGMLQEDVTGCGHTQTVPVIIIHRVNDVLAGFGHVEEVRADSFARYPANFGNGRFHPFDGEMFKEIVNNTEVNRPIGQIDFKNVAEIKARIREEAFGVLDILRTQVEAGIIQQARQAISVEKAVIVC